MARLVMQLFYGKWGTRLDNLNITRWLAFRYVDDARTLLPPIKAELRWEGGRLAKGRGGPCTEKQYRAREL